MKIVEFLFIKLIFNAFILSLILDCINDFSYINRYAMHSNLNTIHRSPKRCLK